MIGKYVDRRIGKLIDRYVNDRKKYIYVEKNR